MIINNNFGNCEYAFEKDYVHVFNLFVPLESRRKGYATKLLKMAICQIRKKGYEGQIDIVTDKDYLKKLYESLDLRVSEYYG